MVTTLPAPIIAFFPTVMPQSKVALEPTEALLSMKVGWRLHPFVIDLDLFQRSGIIIDDHLFAAHKSHLPHLAGIYPAAMDGGETSIGEVQYQCGDIFYPGSKMGFAVTIDIQGNFIHYIKMMEMSWGARSQNTLISF